MGTHPAIRQYIELLHRDIAEGEQANATLLRAVQLLFEAAECAGAQLPCRMFAEGATLIEVHQQVIEPLQRFVAERRRGGG